MGLRLTVALALLACGTLPLNAQWKKYDVKAGIITYETVTMEARVPVSGKVIVYFDRYGSMECKETYVGGILKESTICDGRMLYHVVHDQRTVFKLGPASKGTEVRFDSDTAVALDRSEGRIKMLPSTTIAGKLCQAYEQSGPQGKTKYAGWDHILFRLDREVPDNLYSLRAVSFVETNQVPESKFVPPPWYTERMPHF
ncbi:MAG TPA: hypothetical protein VL126_10225 [Bacteroidota bacterium]|nr:hypothetical protein [Bacteroidota bacterium]